MNPETERRIYQSNVFAVLFTKEYLNEIDEHKDEIQLAKKLKNHLGF